MLEDLLQHLQLERAVTLEPTPTTTSQKMLSIWLQVQAEFSTTISMLVITTYLFLRFKRDPVEITIEALMLLLAILTLGRL